jgi:hypothetical protein
MIDAAPGYTQEMPHWTFSLFLLLLAPLAWVIARLVRRHRLRQQLPQPERHIPRCLRCGYDLRGLGLPRCPECGALRGFRQSMEELGLTPAEIAHIHEKCKEQAPSPAPIELHQAPKPDHPARSPS